MPICQLCLLEKTLLKRSHIIPDFMYKELYNEKNKLTVINPHLYLKGLQKPKMPSDGEYEGGLFCSDCDNKVIGAYETYFSKVVYQNNLTSEINIKATKVRNEHGVELTNCKNISYSQYKLFLLSILWRAHISTRPFFREIDLGPHAEIIRQMLYYNTVCEETEYPILIFTHLNSNKIPSDIIISPLKRRLGGGLRIYAFTIGGFIYMFLVNSKYHNLPEYILESTIKKNNEMNIIHLTEQTGMDDYLRFIGLR
jgi:hypothetical protein